LEAITVLAFKLRNVPGEFFLDILTLEDEDTALPETVET
jgi:hypothetical protein